MGNGINESTKIRNMKKQKVRIIMDSDPVNPRTWDNLGTMVCGHRRYSLGDDSEYGLGDYDSWDEVRQGIVEQEGQVICLPLYLYDHGGLSISTGSFHGRAQHAAWDSGEVGLVYVSKERLVKEYGWKKMSRKREARIVEILNAEVEVYDAYLRGECYGYQIVSLTKCELGEEHETIVDSLWGFYGSDPKTNGMSDYLSEAQLEEAEEVEYI